MKILNNQKLFMDIKEKALNTIEERIESIETAIRKKGIGSDYLTKAEKIQRDVNVGVLLGGATMLLGLGAWMAYRNN